MSEHHFREWWRIDPISELIRRECPGVEGRSGFVHSDLDHLVRRYGPLYNLGQDGDLTIFEKKEGDGDLAAKDRNLKEWFARGLKDNPAYRGYHLLNVLYPDRVPRLCQTCGQPCPHNMERNGKIWNPSQPHDLEDKWEERAIAWIEKNALDKAKSAKLKWDGKDITWEEFINILKEVK